MKVHQGLFDKAKSVSPATVRDLIDSGILQGYGAIIQHERTDSFYETVEKFRAD